MQCCTNTGCLVSMMIQGRSQSREERSRKRRGFSLSTFWSPGCQRAWKEVSQSSHPSPLTLPPLFQTITVSATDNPTLMPLAHYGIDPGTGPRQINTSRRCFPGGCPRSTTAADPRAAFRAPRRRKVAAPRSGPLLEGSASGSQGQIIKSDKMSRLQLRSLASLRCRQFLQGSGFKLS